jgi:hypothetical protein
MKNLTMNREQWADLGRKTYRCILHAVIPAGLFYCVAVIVLKSAGFSLVQILRDTAQQTEQSSFLGFMSNIGSWLWISSASICFFGACTGRTASRRKREMLILTGLLSLILAVDDFFLIHDRYVNQNICFVAYAVAAGALLCRHFGIILQVEGPAFILAGGLLALSILTDLCQFYIPLPYPVTQAMEEGFKFVGAGVWLYFACRIARSALLAGQADRPFSAA